MTQAVLSAGAALAFAAGAAAQDPVTIPESETHRLTAAANGVSYELYVRTPLPCVSVPSGCPAIYLLDAEYSFPLASAITKHLAERGRIPHLIVVSVGYPDKSLTGYRVNRSRDYTPVFDADDGYGDGFQAASGGGPAFLQALEETIIPYVEANFPVNARPRTLVGHSYGGLFALYALMERPDLFDQTISVSPSLWYNDGWVFAHEQTRRAAMTDGANRLYLAVGSVEEQPETGRAMVSDLQSFSARVGAWQTDELSYTLDVLDGETHASVFPRAFSTGLRALFQSEDPDAGAP